MKIENSEEVVRQIDLADKALAASETPAMRAVHRKVEEKIEERRQAEYAAAQAAHQTDAVPPAPAPQRTTIPMQAGSRHRLDRSVSLRLEQLQRRLTNARKQSAEAAKVVQADIDALRESLKSEDVSSAADAFERSRLVRKQLRSARARNDEAEIKRLEEQAAILSREQRAFNSYPTGHGRG